MPARTLVISFGNAFDKAFLVEETDNGFRIIKTLELLSCGSRDAAVFFFKKLFSSQFEQTLNSSLSENQGSASVNEQVLIINDEEAALSAALKNLSASGEVLLLSIGAKKSLLGIGSFGRVELRSEVLGLGQGITKLLAARESLFIGRWMKESARFLDTENYLANKSIYPGVLPVDPLSLEMEQGAATEIVRFLKERFWPVSRSIPKRIILSGAVFAKSPKVYQSLMIFLNGFEPLGFCHIFLDQKNALPAFGELLLSFDKRNFQIEDNLASLGDLISLTHRKKISEELGELTLDLGLAQKQKIILKSRDLINIPFDNEQSGSLGMTLKKGVSFDGPISEINLYGGLLGLVVDARGRPLPCPQMDSESRVMVKKWHQDLGG